MSLDGIPWNKEFTLTWNNYHALPDETVSYHAHTSMDVLPETAWQIVNTSSRVKFKIINIKLTCFFIPSRSWIKDFVKMSPKQAQLLRHEQGHFDGTEEISRTINSKLNEELSGKTFACEGKTEDEYNNFANKEVLKMTNERLARLMKKVEVFHRRYDKETDYGRRDLVQTRYDNKFRKLRE